MKRSISHHDFANSAARLRFIANSSGLRFCFSHLLSVVLWAGIFWTLASGGVLVLRSESEQRDPAQPAQLVQRTCVVLRKPLSSELESPKKPMRQLRLLRMSWDLVLCLLTGPDSGLHNARVSSIRQKALGV
jgi:hypothetical protein